MRKLALFITLSLFTCSIASSQGCLPEGIFFYTQAQIDSFQLDYPGCTEIEGSVVISGEEITNFNGLNVLTTIYGDLDIGYTDDNTFFTDLTGLDNLISIGGYLRIHLNDGLANTNGLNALYSIGEDLIIVGNSALTNLSGLGNLSIIGRDLIVENNPALLNFSGMDSLSSIGGDLHILYNSNLVSMTGLENISQESINNLTIKHNYSLTTCELQNICEYLVSPNGVVNIYLNANGCNSPIEIATAGGVTLSCLPYGNYHFSSQNEVDNFQTNYSGCSELSGLVWLYGDSINNLNGLNLVTSVKNLKVDQTNMDDLTGLENLGSIEGSFNIRYCNILTSFAGLDNLSSIGGDLWIRNNEALDVLSGMDNLTVTGGDLRIEYNDALISLSGLENLTSIGGDLRFIDNDALTSLSALDNLTSIGGDLRIKYNDAMSNLSGLDNLIITGGDMSIYKNNSLFSLSGLDNLMSIGGYLWIEENDALISLSGLNNVTSIGGELGIGENVALTSLSGLDNIEAGSIESITISENNLLSTCDIASICDYLAAQSGWIYVSENAPGCNSIEEVEEACITGVDKANAVPQISIYPNPTENGNITIALDNPHNKLHLTCFNTFGQQIHQQELSGFESVISFTNWKAGIYLAVIYEDGKPVARAKFVVQ